MYDAIGFRGSRQAGLLEYVAGAAVTVTSWV
jgi:hypothetical protein